MSSLFGAPKIAPLPAAPAIQDAALLAGQDKRQLAASQVKTVLTSGQGVAKPKRTVLGGLTN